MATPAKKLSGITNELAKERNRAAAERTLTSWIQNCVSLMSFGIAFDQIFIELNQSFLGSDTVANMRLVPIIGLSVLALGIFLLVLAIFAYLVETSSLGLDNYLYKPIRSFHLLVVVGAVILFGLVALGIVFNFGT